MKPRQRRNPGLPIEETFSDSAALHPGYDAASRFCEETLQLEYVTQ
jgi:hypothetical protein